VSAYVWCAMQLDLCITGLCVSWPICERTSSLPHCLKKKSDLCVARTTEQGPVERNQCVSVGRDLGLLRAQRTKRATRAKREGNVKQGIHCQLVCNFRTLIQTNHVPTGPPKDDGLSHYQSFFLREFGLDFVHF
jgi:hypothetical protein